MTGELVVQRDRFGLGIIAGALGVLALIASFGLGLWLVYEPIRPAPPVDPAVFLEARRMSPASLDMLARAMESCLKADKDFYFDIVVANAGDQAHASCPKTGSPARPVDAQTATAIGGASHENHDTR